MIIIRDSITIEKGLKELLNKEYKVDETEEIKNSFTEGGKKEKAKMMTMNWKIYCHLNCEDTLTVDTKYIV